MSDEDFPRFDEGLLGKYAVVPKETLSAFPFNCQYGTLIRFEVSKSVEFGLGEVVGRIINCGCNDCKIPYRWLTDYHVYGEQTGKLLEVLYGK